MKNETERLGCVWKQPKKQKEYSYSDTLKILESASFPKGLTRFQSLKVFYWAIFEKRKFYMFIESVEKGKTLNYSLKDASK